MVKTLDFIYLAFQSLQILLQVLAGLDNKFEMLPAYYPEKNFALVVLLKDSVIEADSTDDDIALADIEDEEVEELLLCKVCLIRDADMVVTPCGHTICSICVKKLEKGRRKKMNCPQCRASVDATPKLFCC